MGVATISEANTPQMEVVTVAVVAVPQKEV
jgi:hypothetical protein